MRELDEAKKTLHKLTRYKDTVIRVQFPDRLVLQGTFAAVDTVRAVMDFVREYIVDPNLDFVLCEYMQFMNLATAMQICINIMLRIISSHHTTKADPRRRCSSGRITMCSNCSAPFWYCLRIQHYVIPET